jgi:hypothetical protein
VARREQGVFRIFISHRHTDAKLASRVSEEIERLGRFDCWVSGEDIAPGSDWSQAIIEALRRSHLLILLFTVPERQWDWCLYEAGLFTNFADAAEDDVWSVVSIYNPSSGPPRPLAGIHGTPGEAPAIERLLLRLCHEPWTVSDRWRQGAVEPDVDPAAITAAAASIAEGFQAVITGAQEGRFKYPCHRLVLRAPRTGEPGDSIPEEAVVELGPGATSEFTLAIFGVSAGDESHVWGDLVRTIGGEGAAWRTELDAAYSSARRNTLFGPRTASIRAWTRAADDPTRWYHPILYSIEQQPAEGIERIVIVLDPTPPPAAT